MSVTSKDIGSIRALDLRVYLSAHGWKPLSDAQVIDGYKVYVAPLNDDAGKPIELAVPLADGNPRIRDVASRAISLLSVIEDRTEESIAIEMIASPADELEVRIHPIGGGSRIRLGAGKQVYNAIYDLFSYGAYLENKPIPYIKRRMFTNVPDAAKELWLLPSENRSFSFMVQSIIADSTQGVLVPSRTADPLERRVMSRLVRGLKRCHDVAEGDRWSEREYDTGLNANMCDSLLELHQAVSGADIDFSARWSPRYSLAPDLLSVGTIRYTSRLAEKAWEFSQRLKSRPFESEIETRGKIVELRDMGSGASRTGQLFATTGQETYYNPDYSVTIKTSAAGVPRHIHCSLTDADYAQACDALKRQQGVRVGGRLVLQGGKWVLDPLRHFDMIQAKRPPR